MQNTRGPYYRKDYPFLGIVAAVTCGSRAERETFWATSSDPNPTEAVRNFCVQRYGLTEAQTKMFVDSLPMHVPPYVEPAQQNGENTYVPTESYARLIITELRRELDAVTIISPGEGTLDRERSTLYPIIAGLYNGQVPDGDWEEDAVQEVLHYPYFFW